MDKEAKKELVWEYLGKTIYEDDNIQVKFIGRTDTDNILQIKEIK